MEFDNYNDACSAARAASKANPGVGWFVNSVEDDCYTISIYQDYESQDYWLNGSRMWPEWED